MSINMNENFLFKGDSIVRSVSLILYSSEKGYLLCDEMRKGFPDPNVKTLNSHLIGGKVDMDDRSPYYTAFREFCEETGFLISDKSIEDTIEYLIYELDDCKKKQSNICVSEKKKLFNRFYVINLDTCPNKKLVNDIYSFVKNWKSNSTLEKLYFWNEDDELENPSSLLKSFIEILPQSNRKRKY